MQVVDDVELSRLDIRYLRLIVDASNNSLAHDYKRCSYSLQIIGKNFLKMKFVKGRDFKRLKKYVNLGFLRFDRIEKRNAFYFINTKAIADFLVDRKSVFSDDVMTIIENEYYVMY